MFTFGSLFSGIGGIDLGLERAGMHCKWQVENDEYATKVLAKRWANVARYGDIRDCGGYTEEKQDDAFWYRELQSRYPDFFRTRKHQLSSVDLIAGGFPCQDISSAGKRAGITGERSGLWSEFYRLICELRPRYVLVENVAALTSRGLDTVLRNLAEGGYDAEWQVLSAASIGAPHLRERIFIVAYSASSRQQERQSTKRFHDQSYPSSDVSDAAGNRRQWRQYQPLTGKQERTPFPGQDGNGQQMAHTDFQSLEVGQVFGRHAAAQLSTFKRDCSTGTGQWTVEPNVGRVADGVSSRVDRLRGLGNAVVPQVAEYVGRLIMEHDHARLEQ